MAHASRRAIDLEMNAAEFDSLKRKLQEFFSDGLVLIVGSGLSAAAGIPGMDGLLSFGVVGWGGGANAVPALVILLLLSIALIYLVRAALLALGVFRNEIRFVLGPPDICPREDELDGVYRKRIAERLLGYTIRELQSRQPT